jgi:hypothetical protein
MNDSINFHGFVDIFQEDNGIIDQADANTAHKNKHQTEHKRAASGKTPPAHTTPMSVTTDGSTISWI